MIRNVFENVQGIEEKCGECIVSGHGILLGI